MNTMTEQKNLAVTGRQKMTPSEAFVETLVAHGVKDVFGIVGSAYMDALDLFPLAGIRFISVAHEQGGGHMADGYARVSGRHGVCIAQNGPGITNFVTSTAAAFWAHSPVVVVTPETGSATIGLGGFQETEQLPIFSKITKYQAHVNNRARMAELTSRAFDRARLEIGPTQLNIPRDFFYGDIECEIPRPIAIERGAGGEKSLDEAATLLAAAKFPVILCGGGVVMADGVPDAVRARRDAAGAGGGLAICTTTRSRRSHPLWVGPLGYQGSKAAMKLIAQGRRRAGARHAAGTVRHAAAIRDRLLAEGREDHPGRRRREDAGPREADLGRASAATRKRPRRRCSRDSNRASARVRRQQAQARLADDHGSQVRMGGRARRLGARERRVVARSGEGIERHAPAPDAARARARDARGRDGVDRHRQHLLGVELATCASIGRARCSPR